MISDVYSLYEIKVSHNTVKSPTTSIYNSIVNSFFINRWIFRYRWFYYFYSLLALTVLSIKTTLFVVEIFTNFSPKSIDSFFITYIVSTTWLLCTVLETLVYPSAQFIESFDMIWSQLPLSKESAVIDELRESQKFANISSSIIFTTGSSITLITGAIEYLNHIGSSNSSDKFYFLGNKLIEIYSHLIFINIFRGFVIAGNYIKVGHHYIHRRITEIVRDFYASDLTIYRLRHQHYDLVRCVELCDFGFRRFVTVCCSTIVPNIILILYNLGYKPLDLQSSIVYVLLFFQYVIAMSIFFPVLLGFHSCPGLALDDLYLSTLVERSNTFKSEALIFMDLLNQQSCGIKFMGIFLITPDILPNLATIVVTYLMAVPNFITSNKQ
uniref:Gustatory receptor n=1 Tax=Tetranychus urticae TaxID=32264 RepID=T1KLL3_TETUR